MEIKNLIRKMFEKQDELNRLTNSEDWRNNKELLWYRAIWIECAELLNYTDWKWWKGGDTSYPDIHVELVDIWHFGMSDMMKRNTVEECVDLVEKLINLTKINYDYDIRACREYIEDFTKETLTFEHFNCGKFLYMCVLFKLLFTDLFKLYIGKNVLNKFRQDNGYKNKTYIKMWNGQEDNFYLMKILDATDIHLPNIEDKIYDQLAFWYSKLNLIQK